MPLRLASNYPGQILAPAQVMGYDWRRMENSRVRGSRDYTSEHLGHSGTR
jgi:hypothetical protein